MNYTYICMIILLSLKDVYYDIFWYIVLFLITYIALLYLYCWYYDIDLIEEIMELDTDNNKITKYPNH